MEERFIKMFGIFILAVFAIVAVCAMWTQHEKFELMKEAIRSGTYMVQDGGCK